ncbi:hypothetical protein ACFC5X_03455 [Streptomyces sp. NPDC055952]|uniref:hypothetical protein n=1 Tax=Streptomyces sp. NPDC055952 TaxID=3345663 RepID=UPI0035DDCA92
MTVLGHLAAVVALLPSLGLLVQQLTTTVHGPGSAPARAPAPEPTGARAAAAMTSTPQDDLPAAGDMPDAPFSVAPAPFGPGRRGRRAEPMAENIGPSHQALLEPQESGDAGPGAAGDPGELVESEAEAAGGPNLPRCACRLLRSRDATLAVMSFTTAAVGDGYRRHPDVEIPAPGPYFAEMLHIILASLMRFLLGRRLSSPGRVRDTTVRDGSED